MTGTVVLKLFLIKTTAHFRQYTNFKIYSRETFHFIKINKKKERILPFRI